MVLSRDMPTVLAGCPKKGVDAADAAPEAAAAAVVDAGPEAANADKLTHYSDEQRIDHEDATVKAAKVQVLRAVPKGDAVGTIKAGDAVTKISEHNGYFLILFPDPSDPSKKLGGWVSKYVFADQPAAHPSKPPRCTEGTMVSDKVSPLHPRCSKMCEDDVDCPSAKCETAIHLDEKGVPISTNGVAETVPACSVPVATKDGGAKAAAVSVPKCAAHQNRCSTTDHGPVFCADDNGCDKDADCKGKGTCEDLFLFQDDGTIVRTMSGFPMKDKACKPK